MNIKKIVAASIIASASVSYAVESVSGDSYKISQSVLPKSPITSSWLDRISFGGNFSVFATRVKSWDTANYSGTTTSAGINQLMLIQDFKATDNIIFHTT